jgi:hypothetical protein
VKLAKDLSKCQFFDHFQADFSHLEPIERPKYRKDRNKPINEEEELK